MKFIALILTAALTIALGSSVATAQYPQPAGALNLTASTTSAGTGNDVPLECRLSDPSGAPLAGEECTFSIDSEPAGSDAAVGSKVVTRTTDANGIARTTLKTGSVPGQLVVSASSGTFRSVVVVTVTGSATPPASPILPPSTGDGGLVK